MHFIDVLFSNTIYLTILTMVIIFTAVGFAFKNPFRNKTLNYVYKGSLYVVGASPMIVPMFFYWGLADEFKKMTIGRTTLCVMEHYERGGGESSSEWVCRLSIIDKKTGERKERRYIGHTGELLAQRGDTVAYMYNDDLYLLNTTNLEEIYHTDKNDWGKLFPVLQDGVDDIYSNQNTNEPRKVYLCIRGKNGNTYWYDPFIKKMFAEEPADQKIFAMYSTGYDIYVYANANEYYKTLIGRQAISGTAREKIFAGDNYKAMFGQQTDETFIAPKFICADTVKKYFVFVHYKTTDKKEMVVETKDFNFKTIWKKDCEDFEATDSYCEQENQVGVLQQNDMYFNIGGFLLCIDPLTGKEKWKVRL